MTTTNVNAAPTETDAIDQRIAIVVYGPSTGGKTTTARALGRILERPMDPGDEDDFGRTLDFDWLEFEGGSRNGAPVQVQLITAPGHDPVRRIALLAVADVVMFVADTTEDRMDESVNLFAELTEELEKLGTAPAVVVQANKRDEVSALPIDVVRRRLDLAEDVMVIETIATTGDGVRKAFVFAMRHGIQRLDDRKNLDPMAEQSPALDKAQLRRRLEDLPPLEPAEPVAAAPATPATTPVAAAPAAAESAAPATPAPATPAPTQAAPATPPTPPSTPAPATQARAAQAPAPPAAEAPTAPATPAPAARPEETTASLLAGGVPPQLAGPNSGTPAPPPPAAWDAVPPPRREAQREQPAEDRPGPSEPGEGSGWRRLFSRQR